MTILFQGNLAIPGGTNESQVFAIPQNIKQPTGSLEFSVSIVGEDLLPGTTTIQVLLSLDGGLTFPMSGKDSFISPPPQPFRGPPPHRYYVKFSRNPDEVITHAKFITTAPGQFITNVIVEANSV